MRKLALHLLIVFGVTSCHPGEFSATTADGEQFVTGYSLDSSQGPFCTYRFPASKLTKHQVYEVIDSYVPHFSIKTQYFVTRIGYGTNSFLEISSKNFCEDIRSDPVAVSIVSSTHRDPVRVGVLQLAGKDEIVEKFGQVSRGFDLANPVVLRCSIDVETDKAINSYNILQLRYRYAIPILFHQWSVDESRILFENDCDNKERYLEDIFRITKLR